jgi:hypothetical protein
MIRAGVAAASKVSVYDSFQALPDSARQLFDRAGSTSFYHSLPWYQNFVEHALDPGDEIRLYVLAEPGPGGTTLAILPLRASRTRRAGAAPLSSLSNYYTSLYGFILRDPQTKAGPLLDQLTSYIASERPRWDCLNLNPLAHDEPVFDDCLRSFRRAGMVPQAYFSFGNWYLEVGRRTADEYLSGLPSQLRNTIKRKSGKLRNSRRGRMTIVAGGSDLEAAIADYEHVYAASWKVAEPYPRFLPGLIRTCARMGWLRLGLLYVDGEPAAAQLWIVSGKTASIYKLAYQDKFADLSVGTILTVRLMQHVIDIDGVTQVDYLTGDDAYKQDWMSHRRERWGMVAFNPRTLKGAVGILRHVAGRSLRRTASRWFAGTRAPAVTPAPPPRRDRPQ